MTYTQTTFTFKGVNVNTIVTKIMISEIRRPVRPEVTRRKIQIPGRAGSWDFGLGDKQDFNIEVDFNIVAASSGQLMTLMRSLSTFLDGKGSLVFSDDQSKTYTAQVYKIITPRKRVFSYACSGTIIFECDGG